MTELEADGGEELRMLMQQKLTRPTFKRVMSREPTRTPEEIELSRSTVLRILESLQVLVAVCAVASLPFMCLTLSLPEPTARQS